MAISFYRKANDQNLYELGTDRVISATEFGIGTPTAGKGFVEVKAPEPKTEAPSIGYGVYKPTINLDSSTLQTGLTAPDISGALPDANASKLAQNAYLDRNISEGTASLTELQNTLSNLQAQQLKDTEAQKKQAESDLNKIQADKQAEISAYDTAMSPLMDKARNIYDEMLTAAQSINYQELVSQKISLTNDIINYSKMFKDEIEAEASRPTLMSVAQGRQNAIKENYQAKITVSQAAIQAIDGNFNLAFDIMDRGANAINQLTTDRINFLNMVKGLYDAKEAKAEAKLLDLTNEEKTLIDNSIKELQTKIANVEKTKEAIMSLMSSPETAAIAQKAGITLNDSLEAVSAKLNKFYASNPGYNPENIKVNQSLIQKYPDAGIGLYDTPDIVKVKLNRSQLYQKEITDNQLKIREGGFIYDENGKLVPDVSNSTVDQIADAIKKIESNGNYNAKGASGEYGAYQFMPGTWASWSSQYASQVLQKSVAQLPMTPENQDAVAKWKIQQWLNQGYAPEQIASLWNSGSPNWQGKVGTNKQGVAYNVPAYVDKFRNALSQIVGVNTTSDEYDIALRIFNGDSTINVSGYPTAKRELIDKYLSQFRAEAKKSGDVLGIINASAGGKDVDSSFINSFDKATNVIYQIEELQNSFKNDKKLKDLEKSAKEQYSVDLNPIIGKIRKFNPWDLNAQQIKAQLQAIVPNLARGIYGEVGVLTDNDIKNYSQTLPTLTSTEQVRAAVLAFTVKSVQRAIENKLKSQAAAGRDVSGYRDMYSQIAETSDRLLTEAGFGNELYPAGTIIEVNGKRYKSLGNDQFEPL